MFNYGLFQLISWLCGFHSYLVIAATLMHFTLCVRYYLPSTFLYAWA